MSGTMNLASLYGMGMDGQNDTLGMASLTPEQQQRRRQMLYAQALMGQANGQPQRSGWGAVNQAVMPVLGAAMYRDAQRPQLQQTQGADFNAATPNLIWNPNNRPGTSSLNPTTSNQGSDFLNNLGSFFS